MARKAGASRKQCASPGLEVAAVGGCVASKGWIGVVGQTTATALNLGVLEQGCA